VNCLARLHLGLLALAGLCITGCGYSTAPLHRTDVKTVAAPIFASKEFRRNLEFGLSSELVKQIELRTPYKVVQNAKKADTEIRGEITTLSAPVITEDVSTSNPQNYQVTMTCWFEWKDLRTGEILARRDNLGAAGTYATSFGETLDSATAQTTRRLAERIVEAMEKPW
jgi:Lipopolysaccharide-assembly